MTDLQSSIGEQPSSPAILAGRVALVTGGGGGIGAAVARSMRAAGARVVVGDLDVDRGQAIVEELGEDAGFVELDVSAPEQWQTAIAYAETNFGPVDLLVNNAGTYLLQPLEDHSIDAFETVLRVNLMGAMLGIRAVISPMRRAGRGSIVNVGSAGGMSGWWGLSAYCSSKWGLRGLSRCAAIELADYNIRVNAVMPGGVATQMRLGADEHPLRSQHRPPPPPISRLAEPEEIAAAVLFLASDQSSFVTGTELVVDGGLSA
jgi:3alpha(or 20beta)-hydroxysteroid dehydrogenase